MALPESVTHLKCLELCSKFVAGYWTKATLEDVSVAKLAGGVSNRLYHCKLNSSLECSNREVVVRFYGSDLTGNGNEFKSLSESGEAVVAYHLAQLGLAPRVLGLFKGGRVEQFIRGRNVTIEETWNLEVFSVVAEKLAQLHSIDSLPVVKQVDFKFEIMKNFLEPFEDKKLSIEVGETDKAHKDYLLAFDYAANIKWLEKTFSRVKSRIVFCHSDIHRMNILLAETNDLNVLNYAKNLTIIDYEYCMFNYRWIDIAIYFCEMTFQAFEVGGKSLPDHPDETVRRQFIRSYLNSWIKKNGNPVEIDTEDHLLFEADFGVLIVHLVRVLWFLGCLRTNYGLFQNWEYTFKRLKAFEQQKELFETDYLKE